MTSPHTHRLCPGPTPPGRPPVLASVPRQSPQLQTLPSSKLPSRALPRSSREPQPPPTNPPAPPSHPPSRPRLDSPWHQPPPTLLRDMALSPRHLGLLYLPAEACGWPSPPPSLLRPRPGLLPTPGAPSRGRSCPILQRPRGPPSAWCSGCQGRAEALTPDTFPSRSSLSITVRQPLPLLQAPAAPSRPLRLRGSQGAHHRLPGHDCPEPQILEHIHPTRHGAALNSRSLPASDCGPARSRCNAGGGPPAQVGAIGTEVSGEFMERLGPPPPLRSQEAQPHFSSARVPFRPLEPGTLGGPPCRWAGAGDTQPMKVWVTCPWLTPWQPHTLIQHCAHRLGNQIPGPSACPIHKTLCDRPSHWLLLGHCIRCPCALPAPSLTQKPSLSSLVTES